ncbi:Aromatic ring-opening dioxygenase, catalytic subunit, LigB family [Sphingomonas sp. YR710]|uniref:DODA-type extradiol aromatic ring-opening family dioxygenase n=1 Tax=Sphingomonas sp. YR710 TaxID=1882773 RepID=UPI0008894A6A|nr:class III extradiol ring-cleavage dioxygenase [Sphingomonas sp. YR710]SDC34498.1 Aromatic ring-opening dioxygenase, catalytic subunit, LigB family [Sphingomonas sp. YR710]
MTVRQPTLFIPHGGGPCFFMDDPAGRWTGMAAFLRSLPDRLPARPDAILLVSGHWETEGFAFTASPQPPLIYDYYGFPPHTYDLRYDAPGDPGLAGRASALLTGAGMAAAIDPTRGLDHGVFVPLKVAWPDADVPVVEMSVDRGLDPRLHLEAGRALAPLRDQNVLIVGSGMSYHNMRGYGDPRSTPPSQAFDRWLVAAVEADAGARADLLTHWAEAPGGRSSHPREEHLIPLMVAAGAGDGTGKQIYGEKVLETAISGFRFD